MLLLLLLLRGAFWSERERERDWETLSRQRGASYTCLLLGGVARTRVIYNSLSQLVSQSVSQWWKECRARFSSLHTLQTFTKTPTTYHFR